MTIKVALEHRTTYRFDRPVALGPHVVRLRPAPHTRTPVTAYSLRVTPGRPLPQLAAGPVRQPPGPAGLPRARRPSSTITVDLVADLTVINPFDFFVEEYAETFPFAYDAGAARRPRALPASIASRPGPTGRSQGWLGDRRPRAGATAQRTVDFLVELNQRLARDVALHGADGARRPDARRDAASSASGPAATSAWLLVAALRELGLAARFVSGYLVQLTPDAGARRPGGPG